jgi:hypothetical protein
MLAVGAAGGVVRGQQAEASVAPGTSVPATSVGGVLRGMAARAGVVFVGQVLRIEPKGGAVEVTFQVQQAVLGVVGGTFVMREWAGRWTGGQQRYWVGQRAMFFLHAPSVSANGEAGLSSPVDGMVGVVPLVPMGANGGALLDARWLATRVRRAAGAPMVGAATGAIALADAVRVTANWQTTSVAEPRSVALPGGVGQRAVGAVGAEASQQESVPGLLQPQEPRDAQR